MGPLCDPMIQLSKDNCTNKGSTIFLPMPSDEKAKKLNALANQISKCKNCKLFEQATQGVPGDGSFDAEIAFVGEAPGFYEDQQGLPFVGRSGKLLDFMLKQIGYARKDIWIGNIVKHRPPENRDPSPDEIKACQGYLDKQLEIISPLLIVTLGRFSMNHYLPDAKISNDHGVVQKTSKYNIYPVYHPAAGLRNPKMKTALIMDFLKIPEVIESIKKAK